MDYEKMEKLYDLLNDFIDYATDCEEMESSDNVIYEIKKAIKDAENIIEIISLEF